MTLDEIDADLIEPQRLAECVIDSLKIERRLSASHQGGRRRRHGISHREALQALQFEAQLVAVAASNLANGVELSEGDRARLLIAWGRIDIIVSEATS